MIEILFCCVFAHFSFFSFLSGPRSSSNSDDKQTKERWVDPVFLFFLAASVFILTPVISIIWTDENVMDEKPENAAFDTGFALTGNFRYFTA